jgi:hypothetical protein
MTASDPAAGDALPFFLAVSQGWGRSLVYRVYLDRGELLFLDVAPYNVLVDVQAAGRAGGSHWAAKAVGSMKVWVGTLVTAGVSTLALLGLAIARAALGSPGNALQLVLFLAGIAGVVIPLLIVLALWSFRALVVRARALDAMTPEQLRRAARRGGDRYVITSAGLSDVRFQAPSQRGGRVVCELTFKHDLSGRWKLLLAHKDLRPAFDAFHTLVGDQVEVDRALDPRDTTPRRKP